MVYILISNLTCINLLVVTLCLQDVEPSFVKGNGTEAGQIIATTVGGRNGQPKQVIEFCC